MAAILTELDNSPAPSAKASHRLYQAGMTSLVAALVYCYWSTGGDISLAQLIALGIIVLASLPALRWARTRRTWFPAFEISLLICIAFYAVPLFKSSGELAGIDATSRAQAALLVLIYAACANFGFALVRLRPRAPRWATESLLPQTAMRWIPFGMFLNVVFVYISIYINVIPFAIVGTLRAFFFGIGIMSTFILARQWGFGKLNRQQSGFFVFCVVAYLLLTFSSLYLIGGISLLALAIISYASARRHIPWVTIGIGVTVIALLHLGKPEMRKQYWDPETNETKGSQVNSLADLPAFYTEWLGYSMEGLKASESKEDQAPSSLFDRASLIQMICLSVIEVPAEKPYLWGESYVDIPAQFIPRFLWANKPSSLLANIRLAVYFNLVDPDSAFSVSIAFGPLAEAYVNFGYFGVGLFGLLMGAGYKRISMLADGMPQFSALGIFMILLTAWSFQAEQVLATWVSSLFQACVVCIGLPVAYRRFFG